MRTQLPPNTVITCRHQPHVGRLATTGPCSSHAFTANLMPTKRRQHPTTTTTPNKRHPLTAIAATPPEDYTPDEQDDMLAATEDALDADTFDPPNDGDDDDDIDYPPHLRLSSTSNTQEGTLAFLDDPDEFWQLAMDEEAFDERLFKAAVDEAGAAEKPTLLGRMEKQKARISIEQYMKLLPDMQNHEEYVSTSVYEFAPLPETIDDPLQLHRTNPDWDEWDFRAYLESQKRRQAVDAMWHAEQATVGRFEYEAPNWTNDIRLEEKVPDEGHLHEWSEEEVMQLITQNGRSPRIEEVGALTVCNPWQRADFLAAGYEHTPEIDEYIEQLGRMLHEGQEEDADHEVATLASDFADFDIGMGPVDNPLEEEEDEGDPHDDEAPKDL